MTHVRADVARPAQPDHRVHVRAVHVDLPAVLVHDLTDLADRLLEHAVRARVGDHQRRQRLAVRLCLGAKVCDVDVAARIGFRDDHRHARHRRTRRIGAVRGLGDETHLAFRIAARCMIGRDGEQSRVLAL